ncbi:ankyrin repeat domain-containing protein [Streptomyces sp. LaPpAH-108]|uniref:ankyrin repeat domain-containing protein n=1 Tax=Streptomyces sp. LaPpAH-108 TaxID=1155714 RepID=UPI000375F7F1|nr:ankyrin repeat domain-containing protein [Streptomyces sp. LaPpAH-108]
MGFFDDLVLPEEPAEAGDVLARLRPPDADDGRYAPPLDRYVPVRVAQVEPAGTGPETRVLLTGWSVWPGSVTLHLAVFRRTRRNGGGAPRQSGLRVGLLLPDGRRVTSLDGVTTRRIAFTGPQGEPRVAQTDQAIGLIPLDPGLRPALFRTDVDLYLPELPPPGRAELVVEWPDEAIAETRTAVDTDALRAAAAGVVEVWPEARSVAPEPEAAGQTALAWTAMGGPAAFLAPPLSRDQIERLRREEEARQRYVPRADWEGLRYDDWADAALIRARLDGGAAPTASVGRPGTTALHLAAEWGSAEAVRVLLDRLGEDADADLRDEDGHTPLWHAVCAMDEDRVRLLLAAGADAWTPQFGPWSPGRLLLTTPLAPLVRDLPGAVELSEAEIAAQRAADALIAAFSTEPVWIEGLGVCFVRDLTEDEVIRRLGADPADCPVEDLDGAEFDGLDWEESLRYVAVRHVDGTPGGCVITQDGYLPSDSPLLRAVSPGTTAYGLYFNPKGGAFGALARDGEVVHTGEIGLWPHDSDPAYWPFRFWQRDRSIPWGANHLAYACGAAGLTITDARNTADRNARGRWARLGLPEE